MTADEIKANIMEMARADYREANVPPETARHGLERLSNGIDQYRPGNHLLYSDGEYARETTEEVQDAFHLSGCLHRSRYGTDHPLKRAIGVILKHIPERVGRVAFERDMVETFVSRPLSVAANPALSDGAYRLACYAAQTCDADGLLVSASVRGGPRAIASIAADLHRHRITVSRCIDELKAAGLLCVVLRDDQPYYKVVGTDAEEA